MKKIIERVAELCVIVPVAVVVFAADWVYYNFFYDYNKEENEI
jgi:hypothetical protein